MLFKKDELNLIYVQRIIKRFLNKDQSKFINILENLDVNDKIYEFNDFSYVYGYTDVFGYYFIAINKEKEGFMWIKPPQFENNENGLFYGTKSFKFLEQEFYNVFNLEEFRNIYINYIRTNTMEPTLTSFLSVILFRSYPSIKTFNKKITSKIIGTYMFSVIYGFDNSVTDLNKEINDFSDEALNYFLNGREELPQIIKAANFTAINIDKIIKKEISFIDIINYNYN